MAQVFGSLQPPWERETDLPAPGFALTPKRGSQSVQQTWF